MKKQIQPKLKRILVEFLIYSIGFFLSISLMPMCIYYYERMGEPMISEPQYLNDFRVGYVFIVLFVLILLAFFTLKKAVIIVTNSVSILVSLFLFFVIVMSFAWWGASPFHPDFGYGLLLSQLFMLLLIVRTFTLTSSLNQLTLGKRASISVYVSAGLIIVGVIIFACFLLVRVSNAPVYVWGAESIMRNRKVYSEKWEYENAYNAYIIKYSSSDTLRNETYRQDSVRFVFFNDHQHVRKQFTKKGGLTTERIEELLEANVDF